MPIARRDHAAALGLDLSIKDNERVASHHASFPWAETEHRRGKVLGGREDRVRGEVAAVKIPKSKFCEVNVLLAPSAGKSLGLQFRLRLGRFTVNRILINGLGARSKKIKNGDILTEINHTSVKGLSEREVMAQLTTLPIALTFMRLPNARKVPLSLNVLPPVEAPVLPPPAQQEPVYKIQQKEEAQAKLSKQNKREPAKFKLDVSEEHDTVVEKECTLRGARMVCYNPAAVTGSQALVEANEAFDRY
jgi:hypothetical protein